MRSRLTLGAWARRQRREGAETEREPDVGKVGTEYAAASLGLMRLLGCAASCGVAAGKEAGGERWR